MSRVMRIVRISVVQNVCNEALVLSVGGDRLNRAVDSSRREDIDALSCSAWLAMVNNSAAWRMKGSEFGTC